MFLFHLIFSPKIIPSCKFGWYRTQYSIQCEDKKKHIKLCLDSTEHKTRSIKTSYQIMLGWYQTQYSVQYENKKSYHDMFGWCQTEYLVKYGEKPYQVMIGRCRVQNPAH